MSWVVEMQFEKQDTKLVKVASKKLAEGIRAAIASNAGGFQGVDEDSGDAVNLTWVNAVSVTIREQKPVKPMRFNM